MSKRISRADLVRKLSKKWENFYKEEPYLKSIHILDSVPLRGIKNSKIELEFPVSVICGPNGVGKSTFLSLAILGFHAKEPPLVPLRNIRYFDFNYFYRSTSSDKHDSGISIEWEYTDGSWDSIVKGEQRWLRYMRNSGEPRRPVRGTEFVGLSRITPAFEKKNYHSYFSNRDYLEEVDAEHAESLSRVMGKRYKNASQIIYQNSAGTHLVHQYNKTHTSFNAGAGEECISHILTALTQCPEGSIIGIEEIEIGLHPSILGRLVDVILEIALERHLQILITSHSTEFLRRFPDEGIILAERSGDSVEFTTRPNVEYAIHRMGGDYKPVVGIICEDEIAGRLICASLSMKLRALCPVISYGGKDDLIRKAELLDGMSIGVKPIIVWDGDVRDSYIDTAKKKGISACRLPGGVPPEEYIWSWMQKPDGKAYLMEQFGLTKVEVAGLYSSISVLKDAHDLWSEISYSVGLPVDDVVASLISHVALFAKSEFQEVVDAIGELT